MRRISKEQLHIFRCLAASNSDGIEGTAKYKPGTGTLLEQGNLFGSATHFQSADRNYRARQCVLSTREEEQQQQGTR